MSKKYVLHPGEIHDIGTIYFVGVAALARAYAVALQDYIVARSDGRPSDNYGRAEWDPELIHLRPRADGNYTLPDVPRGTISEQETGR